MRVLLAAVLFTLGCGNRNADQGLPPAESWQANAAGGTMSPFDQPQRPQGRAAADFDDPHRGVPGAPPLGADLADDPHRGVPGAPPLGPGDLDDEGGAPGSPDVTQLGLPPPDPNRTIDPGAPRRRLLRSALPIDPNRRVAGTLRASPQTASRLKPNGVIFVIAKQADASGAPVGPPVAVEKLTWTQDEVAFELTEDNAMVAGTALTGDIVITARYDQDADASSKDPGDVVGHARVKVPADKLAIVLDTVLP